MCPFSSLIINQKKTQNWPDSYFQLHGPIDWPSGSERRFYDGHDRKVDGSTPTQASLLRPWIRRFTIISAWWNLASSKWKKSEAKFKRKPRKQGNS